MIIIKLKYTTIRILHDINKRRATQMILDKIKITPSESLSLPFNSISIATLLLFFLLLLLITISSLLLDGTTDVVVDVDNGRR